MADSTLNRFVGRGTNAEMLAFVPDPPTPASGPDSGYVFFNTDDNLVYGWDGANWVAPAGSGDVVGPGSAVDGEIVLFDGTSGQAIKSATGTGIVRVSSGVYGTPGDVDLTSEVTGTLPSANLPTPVITRAITCCLDGGGSTITTGIKADVYVPYACTITAVTMLADQSGAIVVDIWKDTYANYPPTDADSITAAAPPTISGPADKSQDTTLSGWTTSISAGDTLRFNVDSVTDIQRLALTLTVTV